MEPTAAATKTFGILQKRRLQNNEGTLNFSWKYLNSKTTDPDKQLVIAYLHFNFLKFIGNSLESIFERLGVPEVFTPMELITTESVVKISNTRFISNYRLPYDCFVRNYSILTDKDIAPHIRMNYLRLQSYIPPYVSDLWIPEEFVPKVIRRGLLRHNLIEKSLNGFMIFT